MNGSDLLGTQERSQVLNALPLQNAVLWNRSKPRHPKSWWFFLNLIAPGEEQPGVRQFSVIALDSHETQPERVKVAPQSD